MRWTVTWYSEGFNRTEFLPTFSDVIKFITEHHSNKYTIKQLN